MYVHINICVCVLAIPLDQEHAGRAMPVTEVLGGDGGAVAAVPLGPWLEMQLGL